MVMVMMMLECMLLKARAGIDYEIFYIITKLAPLAIDIVGQPS